MWKTILCPCGHTFTPMVYEPGSIHMDQHVFDQWSVSHLIWGFTLGFFCQAPNHISAWKIGLLFVLWELWENVIETAFSTYAPGEYHGDSLVNSLMDMLPSMSGVWLGRQLPQSWPVMLLAELWATRQGFGIHSVFLGHQGSICDIRTDPATCGRAYVIRLVICPTLTRALDGLLWRWLGERHRDSRAKQPWKDDIPYASVKNSPTPHTTTACHRPHTLAHTLDKHGRSSVGSL